MKVFILLATVVLAVSARPQDYDDYDQPTARPASRKQQQQARPAAQQVQQQAQPQQQQQNVKPKSDERETTTWIPIIQYNKQQGTDGSYKTQYETGNNIISEETGYLKNINEDNPSGTLVQKGSYSYETPDGNIINVEYVADEKGFQVSGEHLPTPPPVSPEIQAGLDLIYEGIRIQEERRKNDPNWGQPLSKEERARLNFLGLYTGN